MEESDRESPKLDGCGEDDVCQRVPIAWPARWVVGWVKIMKKREKSKIEVSFTPRVEFYVIRVDTYLTTLMTNFGGGHH